MSHDLTLDLTLASASVLGDRGVTPTAEWNSALVEVLGWFSAERSAGRLAFSDVPADEAPIDETLALVARLEPQALTDVVVLGIGGSSLGARALCASSLHPFHNLQARTRRAGPRIFFPDNADPVTWNGLWDVIEPETTLFLAVTKSGGTAETWAQLLDVLRRRSGSARPPAIAAVTDPTQGVLRAWANEQGWPALSVPPAVGGRFSVVTPVGLLPAALAGVDIRAFQKGAARMATLCQSPDVGRNPAFLLAQSLCVLDRAHGRPVHVFMPYCDALRETGDWFVQLWAESLGKKTAEGHVGPTPVRAIGATDQHSLVQNLMEGPQDKVVVFVGVQRPRSDYEIPRIPGTPEEVAFLAGTQCHHLLQAELKATQAALAGNGRPSLRIDVPELTPYYQGQLMMLWMMATAFAGRLYGVDPFNQPGVEAGKRYTSGLLGRRGYERERTELENLVGGARSWVSP